MENKENYCSFYINGHEVKFDTSKKGKIEFFDLDIKFVENYFFKLIQEEKTYDKLTLRMFKENPSIFLFHAAIGLQFIVKELSIYAKNNV